MSACNVIYIQIFKNGDGKHLDFSDRHHLFQYRFSVVPLGMSTLPTDGGQPWSKRGGRQERGISDWRFPYRRHLSGFRKLSDCLTVSGFKKKKKPSKTVRLTEVFMLVELSRLLFLPVLENPSSVEMGDISSFSGECKFVGIVQPWQRGFNNSHSSDRVAV